ncbi:MAG: aldehyde oxidase and xanthine dehydrogenase, molybdopterin binding, partial [Verrucomicrobiales bacterium]|nr:aldehyde oxidase and xanthine dehydrogenase, molybdopterin binding [Verrucomicrobiales bacterium]
MKSHPFPPGFEPERYELDEPGRSRWLFPRRQFFKSLGAGVLVVLFAEAARGQESGNAGTNRRGGGGGNRPQELSAWLHIDEQGNVTVFTGKVEVGQNIRTTLTQIVSEELHSSLSSIRLVMADTLLTPFDAGTFGSRSTPDMGSQLRRVAATAREVLVDLASEQWKVDKSLLTARDGKIWNGEKSISFGELTKGQKLTARVNDKAAITRPDQWKVAGTSVLKVNGRDIVTGKHRYTIDQKVPGLLHAKILRPPSFGSVLLSLDDSAAKQISGVEVYRDQGFVGVLAPDEWTARKGLLALLPQWKTEDQKSSNKDLFQTLRSTANFPQPEESKGPGDPLQLSATYTVSYIAHAPLEPRGAVAEWKDNGVTVWTGTQRPFGVRSEVAKALNLPEEKVRLIVPDTGSGYGGKHTGEAAIEAARLAQLSKKSVKLTWTREEEFTWAYFRPAGVMDIRSSVHADGLLQTWEHHNFNSGNS